MTRETTTTALLDGERQVTIEDIYETLHKFLRASEWKEEVKDGELHPDSDLWENFGNDGWTWEDFFMEYQDRFEVNLDGYVWYFHHEDGEVDWFEGIFPTRDQLVTRIPVTPAILLDSARLGRWSISYPEHEFPKEIRHREWSQNIHGYGGCLFMIVCISFLILQCLGARALSVAVTVGLFLLAWLFFPRFLALLARKRRKAQHDS